MKFSHIKKCLWVLLLPMMLGGFSVSVLSKEVTVTHKPEITIQPRNMGNRVCLYEGKHYSLGAIVVVENVVLECGPENSFETNGRLKWHKVAQDGK